jgi:hypothetical protein
LGDAEFAAQAVLEHTPETFDAAFGLRRLRGDEGDAELRARAPETGWAVTGSGGCMQKKHPTDLVEPMGFESTNCMKTKEFCGAPWPSKVLKRIERNP